MGASDARVPRTKCQCMHTPKYPLNSSKPQAVCKLVFKFKLGIFPLLSTTEKKSPPEDAAAAVPAPTSSTLLLKPFSFDSHNQPVSRHTQNPNSQPLQIHIKYTARTQDRYASTHRLLMRLSLIAEESPGSSESRAHVGAVVLRHGWKGGGVVSMWVLLARLWGWEKGKRVGDRMEGRCGTFVCFRAGAGCGFVGAVLEVSENTHFGGVLGFG